MQTSSVTTTQRITRPACFVQRATSDVPDPCLSTGRWHPAELARAVAIASASRAVAGGAASEPSTEPVPMETSSDGEAGRSRWLDLETVKVLLLSLLLLAVVGGWLAP